MNLVLCQHLNYFIRDYITLGMLISMICKYMPRYDIKSVSCPSKDTAGSKNTFPFLNLYLHKVYMYMHRILFAVLHIRYIPNCEWCWKPLLKTVAATIHPLSPFTAPSLVTMLSLPSLPPLLGAHRLPSTVTLMCRCHQLRQVRLLIDDWTRRPRP